MSDNVSEMIARWSVQQEIEGKEGQGEEGEKRTDGERKDRTRGKER